MPTPDLSDSHRDFYVAIGRAITAFANIERVLAQTFSAATGDTKKAATDALFVVPTFDAKLAATNAALKAALVNDQDRLGRWKPLANRAKAASEIRNIIAHNTIWIEHPHRDDPNNLSRKNPDHFPDGRLWLAQIHLASGDRQSTMDRFHAKRMDTLKIVQAEETFVTLMHEVNQYANDLGAALRGG
jgi:hypothetical protein